MKKENNTFYNSYGDKKIAFQLIRELGEAGACILLKKENKKYIGKPISFIDIKNANEKISGKEINIVNVSNEEIDEKYNKLGFHKLYQIKWNLWT